MRHQLTIFSTSICISMMFIACTHDFEADVPLPASDDTTDEGYVVSVQQALTNLNNELAMIYTNHLPFFMRGEEYDRDNSGHAWVIDGWNEYKVRYWNCYYYTHGGQYIEVLDRILLSTETYTKVHCNFGWGGLCDGYYSERLFDTTKRLYGSNIDTSVGDYGGTAGYVFNNDFKMVRYTIQSHN